MDSLGDLGPILTYADHLGEAFLAVDRAWSVRAINGHALRFFGRTREEVVGRPYWDLVPPTPDGRATLLLHTAMAQGRPTELNAPSQLHPGRQLQGIAIPLRDGLAISFRDVTLQQAAERDRERQLVDRESRLRLAIDAGRMAIWAWDAATETLTGSPELNRILGFPPDHPLTLEDSRARYYPGEGERLRAAAQEALQAGERYFEVEFRIFWADGTVRWLMLRAEIELRPDRAPGSVVGVLLDITDRKRAEETLREQDAQLRDALSAASLATFDVDHATGAVAPSTRLNEIYGYPAAERLTLEHLRRRYHPDDLESIFALFSGMADPSVRHFEMEFRLLLPDGQVRWVSGRGEYVRDEAGRVTRSRGIVLDITERKRWEERQQLLINELNHRVKNTLATVQSIASQSLRNAQTADQARSDIEGRLIALSRAHDVLTREGWEGANLREILAEAIAPFGGLESGRFSLSGPDLRLSPRIALALAMAIHELATNAVKYGALSNETGRIAVVWRVEAMEDVPHLRLQWEESEGPPVATPSRRGFGSRLIERSLASDLGGDVALAFRPAGVVCTVVAPIRSDSD